MQAFHGSNSNNINIDQNISGTSANLIYSKEFVGALDSQDMNSNLDADSLEAKELPYTPLFYASNYFSALASIRDDKAKQEIRLENESLLKRYYSSKKSISHAAYRQGSITSCGDSNVSTTGSISAASGAYGKSPQTWLNKFLDNGTDLADTFDFQLPYNMPSINTDNEENERREMMETPAVKAYYSHFQKLLMVDIRDPELLRRHNMWMPTVRKLFRSLVLNENLQKDSLYGNKTSPLFLEGSKYIPKDYDTYGGCTILPSFFSEYKLPSFCYHSGIELNGQIFIIGGLVACHKYDEEAPSLKDFQVDGVKNLPPPLLPKIINNPSMINNSRLYIIATRSCRISRPEISGTIPPPLLCMRASKLTERYIFYYGGFEIKTETTIEHSGTFKLKKRAFVNNTAYILDTITFKFSKVELTALPYKYVTYPTLAARFGHMQVSTMANSCCCNHNQKNSDCCDNGGSTLDSEALSPASNPSSGAPSITANSTQRSNNNHSPGVYTTIIFGGYRQTGDDKYEAMNDMWKIEVSVVARGKRGYFKFGGTATASIISKSTKSDPWPSCRAFFGYGLESTALLNKANVHATILKDLKDMFYIDSKPLQSKIQSKSIFPNIPHSRRDAPSPKHALSNRESYASSATSIKQRSYASLSTSNFTGQQGSAKKLLRDGGIIVVHGGSNKNTVCGDMWWFNIEKETWTSVTTFGKSEDCGLIPIEVGLVGHSMVNVGHICVCLGGLTQADVNEMYMEGELSQHDVNTELNVGNDFLNIFDLTTQCLQGHKLDIENKDGQLCRVQVSENPFTTSRVMSFGCSVLHVNGWIILVGGLVAKRSNINDIYMRGAILECVLPSANLAS